jgi:flagellar biogenesis protein FliO
MFRTLKLVCIAFIVANSCLLAQQDSTPFQDLDTSSSLSPASKELMPFYEGPSFTRMWITIAAALVLLFSTLWLLRRFKTGHFKKFSNSSTLNILEKRALSPKTLLYIIEIDGKRLLISESQVEVRTLNQEDIVHSSEEN